MLCLICLKNLDVYFKSEIIYIWKKGLFYLVEVLEEFLSFF